jgi:putative MFS transporter
MAPTSAAELAARLDRLPMTRHIWVLVTLISLGGGFELYDGSIIGGVDPRHSLIAALYEDSSASLGHKPANNR